MKKILYRNLLVNSLLVLMPALLFFMTQFIFLENYFTASVKKNFQEVVEKVAWASVGTENLTLLLRELGNEYGCKIMITDRRGSILVSSVPEFHPDSGMILNGGALSILRKNREKLDRGEELWELMERKEDGIRFLYLFEKIKGRRFLVIQQPLNPLRRYVDAAGRFYGAAILVVLLIGFVPAWIFARKMTEPIRRLTSQAESIAALDFSGTFPEGRRDEIGDLGRSMNTISRDLSMALEELKGRMDAQKRFLASVAHEIRTPVGLLRGYAELFDEDSFLTGDPGPLREAAGVITSEADHLNRLLEDLLLLFRLEQQEPETQNSEELDLQFLLEKTVRRFQPLLDGHSLEVKIELHEQLFLFADYHRMLQVLDNILANALRHSPPNSAIKISTEKKSRQILIRIWNPGPSIPEKDLERIFDPLYRPDRNRGRASGGTGLGLAVVKSLVEAQKGRCYARNEENGVAFYLEIPAQQ